VTLMGLLSDIKVMPHMLLPRVGKGTHAERLERFYRGQAKGYDEYRRKLLHGRRELYSGIPAPQDTVWIDMGGGTGSNIEHLGDRREACRAIRIVDLCPSLLRVADERIGRLGWRNVKTALADATLYEPDCGPADVVTFSYSLTMIPDWFRAVDRALEILRPGGSIGVVDFTVSRKWPAPGRARHSRLQRIYWTLSFSWDNVFLSPDHVPYLESRFETVSLAERFGKVPYLFGLEAPYYIFIGRKAGGM
jgi:S-adenosylmethionine-diacylgycerolhomoserine-N-methlytransferase